MTYRHLTQNERYLIVAMHAGGWRVCEIALALAVRRLSHRPSAFEEAGSMTQPTTDTPTPP